MLKAGWNKSARAEVAKREAELFETNILPCLDSAYNLARWLTGNDEDAQDVLQDACLRALSSYGTFLPGRDIRPWLLAIVRNCSRSHFKRKRWAQAAVPLEEETQRSLESWSDPEAALIRKADSLTIRAAMEELPVEYREILVLREWEDLSYKEIADIAEIPIGTVMSRLSRARRDLHARLTRPVTGVAR